MIRCVDAPVPRAAPDRDRGPALDAALLAAAAGLPLAAVEVCEAIDSTNREMMQRAPLRIPEGAEPACHVLLAGRQVAGRGRRGRVWLSDPADSLTFSVAVDHRRTAGTPPLVGLSLALGAAVAGVASERVPGVGLKWPNDLLRDGRKCAGMLVETRTTGDLERIVIGLGVNLRLPQEIARTIDQPACGLLDGADALPRREVLAGKFARALIDATLRFLAEGFADTAARWAPYDVLQGREVTILEDGRARIVGRAVGLDGSGALMLATPAGVVAVSVGDVSARLGDLTSGAGSSR